MIITTMQSRSSANTSMNSVKLPTAFTKVTPHGHVCDFGCGKYTDHIKAHCDLSGALSYNPYDPYNQPEDENNKTAFIAEKRGFDMVYCCNVLNVIDSLTGIYEAISTVLSWLLYHRGTAIFQIYEGDKSGIGKETKWDCWQRNERAEKYIGYIIASILFMKKPDITTDTCTITRKGNIIIVEKNIL